MKRFKQTAAYLLIAALTVTPLFCGAADADAASKRPALSLKRKTLVSGKTTTLKLKNARKASVSWKTSKKKVVAIKKKTRTSCKIKALSKGKSTITCKVKSGKKVTRLTCKVTVSEKKAVVTKAPAQKTAASPTPSASATPNHDSSPSPTPSRHPLADESILDNYEDLFGYVGTCLSYESPNQLQRADIVEHVKKHYNSFTLENEMKPEAILGSSGDTISVSEAKKLGYLIPDNYKEKDVPKLNFECIDEVLKVAYDNGLHMRAHTLLWHSQTPAWFFSEDYDSDTAVKPETMNARLEFYIRTLMTHIMDKELEITGKSGSIIYAWDVVNEYLHRGSWGLNWTSVYGDMGDQPSYVKKAFEVAYDVLKSYNATEDVVLFYNDYNPSFGYKKEGETNEDQAAFMGEFMDMVISKQLNRDKSISPKGITSLTLWGLYDNISWRRRSAPLLFGKSINDPKPSFYTFIEAAKKINKK